MRAAVITEIGSPPSIGEAAEPQRGPGQTLVEVTAAALNPVDISISTGAFYGGSPDPPYVMGREAVGRVIEGDNLAPGTAVWFQAASGGSFAERAVADEHEAIVLPPDTDHPLAAGLGIAGLTGWLALEWSAKLRSGERVLVLGATGVVGLVAVQVARVLGAGRIVAAGRDRDALSRAEELGAHASAVLPAEFDEQFDVVIDPLWGEPAAAATRAMAFGARLVQIGQSAGNEATLRSSDVRGRSLAVLGFSVFHVPHEKRAAAYGRLLELAAAGELEIDCETLALDDAAAAWERQRESPHRKLVLVP